MWFIYPSIIPYLPFHYFFIYHLSSSELTLKRYKFNWANPTANWKLNLEDKLQRIIMFQLVAINNVESDFSKNSSNRGDTSQNVSSSWMMRWVIDCACIH